MLEMVILIVFGVDHLPTCVQPILTTDAKEHLMEFIILIQL